MTETGSPAVRPQRRPLALTLEVPDDGQAALAQATDCFSAAELGRYRGLAKPADRLLFRAAHTLARVAVARCHGGSCGEVEIDYHATGQPFARIARGAPLAVSWAHCEGAVACLTGTDSCGVDIEPLVTHDDVLDLAREAMHRDEIDEIRALDVDDRSRRFLQSWTVKEALSKAMGEGFGGARGRRLLHQCSLHPRPGGIEVRAPAGLLDVDYAAALATVSPHHLAAFIVAGQAEPISIRRLRARLTTAADAEDLASSLVDCGAVHAAPLARTTIGN